MKILGIIPARYASSRFPGKPLAEIDNKPMIWWVYQKALCVEEFSDLYVATDDQRIYDAVKSFGGNVIMTSDKHLTGSDRVAEVAGKIDADLYVNIQGDEPMVQPENLRLLITSAIQDNDAQVMSLMARINNPMDMINPSVVKVITSATGRGIYLTRGIPPYPKGNVNYNLYKHYGIYTFTKSSLEFFHNTSRGRIEQTEDIEILRFIENGYYVKFLEVDVDSVSVDTEHDLEKVRYLLSQSSTREKGNLTDE